MPWTRFMDMHSGGGTKEEPYEHIYIEAPRQEAVVVFYKRFGHNPFRVTCTCCGEDYSVDESPTLEEASGYDRGCQFAYIRPDGTECSQDEAWRVGEGLREGYRTGYLERRSTSGFSQRDYQTIADYAARGDVLIIRAADIKDDERSGDVPE